MRENCIHLALYKLTSSRLHFLSYTGEKKKKNLNPPGKKKKLDFNFAHRKRVASRTTLPEHVTRHFRFELQLRDDKGTLYFSPNQIYIPTLQHLCKFIRIIEL